MSSHISINFKNYKKTKDQVKNIHQKLDFLMKQIPCDSRVTLDFNYKEKTFYGKLKVDTTKKSFFSSDEGPLLEGLAHSLCKKAHKQVMKWKKSRTLEEITGVIALGSQDSSLNLPYKKTA